MPHSEVSSDDGIKQVRPIPVSADTGSSSAPSDDHEKRSISQSPWLPRLNSCIPLLQSVQKYSSYTFTTFAFIHGLAVVVAPAISTSLADDLIGMGRQLYQDSGLEWILVWGSLGLHVLSGVAVRSIRQAIHRLKHGDKRRKALKRRTSLRDSIPSEEEVIVKEEGGLTGGISGYAGMKPARTSFVSRVLGLTPLQMAGYLSIPLVTYHALQVRILPLCLEGDSSYIGLDYLQYILSSSHGIARSCLNWLVYPSMVLLTTYHSVYGLLFWNNVKQLRLRKLAMNFISLVALCGLYSLYAIHKMDSSVPQFIKLRFSGYLDKFYLF